MTESQHPLDNKLLLGRYRVMRLLGEGGMGTVHLARVEGAEGFIRPVVVKRMKRDIRSTEEGNRLFIREAKILSKLHHPSIVGISDFGIEDDAHIMVLEYVHGYNLGPWLDYREHVDQPLPVDVCLYIVRRILDALHYAHHFDTEEGREIEIVHRDISPDNVLLSNKGHVHLLDFGIASMRGPEGGGSTKSGSFRGKLCYSAPETVDGKPATPRSDQYSAAIVLLELLTGNTPFVSDTIAQTFSKMVNEYPEPASAFRKDIPPGLDDVISQAISKDPDDRFESALAFARQLRRYQRDDDDEVGQQLSDLVGSDFERMPSALGIEGLKTREAALEKILSVMPGPGATAIEQGRIPQAASLPTIVVDSASPPERRSRDAVPSATAPEQKQLQGLLWGLLLVGGLIALGLGAAVALLSRSSSDDKVVVVGGERQPDTTTAPTSDDSNAEIPGTEDARVDSTTRPTLDVVPERPPEPTSVTKSAPAKNTRDQKLSKAVQSQSAAFQGCFTKHMQDPNKPPKAVLHFSVAKQGGPATISVAPSTLAASPLGACLKGAAGRVQFPALEEAVSFSLPVRARVTR